jgi:hypothetical protein
MKVFWWQAGLHLEPESKLEFKMLNLLSSILNRSEVEQQIVAGPISGNLGDQESVGLMNEVH